MVEQLTKAISTAVLGAFAFWLPDVAIHAVEGKSFGAGDVVVASLAMIVTVLASLRFDPHGRRTLVGLTRGVAVVVGIWFLGPFMMMCGATFSGGGYAVSSAPLDWLFLFIPGIAFIIATYDGALGALHTASGSGLHEREFFCQDSAIFMRFASTVQVHNQHSVRKLWQVSAWIAVVISAIACDPGITLQPVGWRPARAVGRWETECEGVTLSISRLRSRRFRTRRSRNA